MVLENIGELIFINLWLFGALCFWPILRFILKLPVDKLHGLKWQFWLQAIGLCLTFGLVYYNRVAGYEDWLHALIFPYTVGFLGWVGAVIAFAVKGFKNYKTTTNIVN